MCHDERLLMEVTRSDVCVDQLDLRGLCLTESVIRRATEFERAVERNPHHPDFSGPAVMEGGVTTERANMHVCRGSASISPTARTSVPRC